ncbi:MAG: UPF0182 family protein [Nocardioidaceae bacterium]|nr:UPF0182 family protein [Nocardioidaceae bacterium]
MLFSVFVEVWTGRLWFASLNYSSVFSTMLWTRVGLFVVFGLVLAAVAVGNALLAFRMRPILIGDGYRNPTVERYQDVIDPIRHWVLMGIGLLAFLFGGATAAGQWKTYLLWRHGVPFGETDVYFDRDIGFFVFGYPWYRFLISFGFTVLVISFLLALATHYLYGGIRLQARRNKVASGAQVQLSVLLGLFMLVRAASYWLDRYGLAFSEGNLITGITYTDANAVLPSKNILAIIAIICALLFFGNVFRPGWMLPVLGFGLLILSAVLIGGIWPALVQRFQVKPTEADKEAAYIQLNIEATRTAYDLEDIKMQDYAGTTTDTAEQLQRQAADLPGVRLIDPRLVSDAFEQLQQVRGFYTVPDVLDVDRYTFEGETEPQDVVLAVREIDLAGVPADQRNWTNDHTVFTHGYGVVAAYGDRRTASGQPDFAQKNLPSMGRLGEFEQRVYFGELGATYSIVGAEAGKEPVELNIPDTGTGDGADENSTYDGAGGVPIGSTFTQLLYAAKFWESSILLSGRVDSESRLIYDRRPHDMVQKVAPWLTVDGDPYPAVVDGRLLWILDGYTSTANYPMSNLVDLSDATSDSLTDEAAVVGQASDDINYMRNSVKATVDAYDGTVTLYEWDETDPLLRAWRGAFPEVVVDKTEIPESLLAHLRYPEDLFKVQRELFSRYHVTDANTFYGGSENWTVPEDPTVTPAQEAQPPFYLSVKIPGEEPQFSLTSVYVPENRQNLASFMTVNADAASERYGEFTVLELPGDNAVSGPGQVANALQSDPVVSAALLKYKTQGNQVDMGNLLTLPIGDELLYVQPVYTRREGTGSYPILQFVLVAVGEGGEEEVGKVGLGTSFEEAFANALGLEDLPTETPPTSDDPDPGPGNGGGGPDNRREQLAKYLSEAEAAFVRAQTAYEAGDLGAYQEANEEAMEWVEKAIALQQAAEGSGDDPEPGDTPTETTAPTETSPTTTTPPTGTTTEPTETTASPGG